MRELKKHPCLYHTIRIFSMRYFTEEELKCQHCGEYKMNADFMEKIEALRYELGFPFVVTSAYRCAEHPIEARKKAVGAHVSGRAIDIAVSGNQAHRLLEAALSMGLSGIGVKQKGTGRFIHLDDLEWSESRPRPWVWSY